MAFLSFMRLAREIVEFIAAVMLIIAIIWVFIHNRRK
jgi:hypothetical protein